MTSKLLALSAIVFMNFSLNAQDQYDTQQEKTPAQHSLRINANKTYTRSAPIWGAGASSGSMDGEFANPFGGGSWTAVSENESGGATVPGNAFWVRNTTGVGQGAYWGGIDPIASTTQANGVALFDSDYMDNNGNPGGFGTGTSPSPHRGYLISPAIDLTGYTDSALALDFYAYWRDYSSSFTVSMSVNDGFSWTDIDIGAQLPSGGQAVQGWVKVVFPNITQGVANLTSCRIKFTFDGDYYFAMVDDLSLSKADDYDLAIATVNPNSSVLSDAYYQAQILRNAEFPIDAANDSIPDQLIGVNLKNFGTKNVLPEHLGELHCHIQKNNSGTWTTVHSQTIAIDTVYSFYTEGVSQNLVLDTIDNFNWIEVGEFRTIYATQLMTDNVTYNDSAMHYFTINDNNYISKLTRNVDGTLPSTRPVFPGGLNFQTYEYGSMFNVPNGGTLNYQMDSITAEYYVSASYSGNASIVAQLRVYKFEDGANGGTLDGVLDDNGSTTELTLVAMGSDTLENLVPGTYFESTASIFDVNTLDPFFQMSDNEIYFVTVYLDAAANSMASFNSNSMIWLGASDAKNYAINLGNDYSISNVSPVSVVDEFGTGEWYWVGFGADLVPSIGVHLSTTCTPGQSDYSFDVNNLVVTFTDESVSSGTISAWNWDFGDGNTSSQQNPVHFYAAVGTYTVCLEMTDDCGTYQNCQTVETQNVNIENASLEQVSIFPIPSASQITIAGLPGEPVNFVITNAVGQVVWTSQSGSTVETIDISNLASGIYQLTMTTNTDQAVKTIIVN